MEYSDDFRNGLDATPPARNTRHMRFAEREPEGTEVNTKIYKAGDDVLVRHMGSAAIQATIVSVGKTQRFWGPQYVVRGPHGEFNAYGNEFIEPGDSDFIF